MKESHTLVGNAADNLLRWEVFLDTKAQYMKESNTLAGNAAIKLLQKVILPNTKRQNLRESNTLAVRQILLDTRKQYIKGLKHSYKQCYLPSTTKKKQSC